MEPYFIKYGITNSVTQFFQGFSTSYNSLQVKFDRRFSKGLTMTTAVTWSKVLNFQSGDDGGLDFYAAQGIQRNYARADYDREFTYVQSYVYKLPIGQGEKFLSQQPAWQDPRRVAGFRRLHRPIRQADDVYRQQQPQSRPRRHRDG